MNEGNKIYQFGDFHLDTAKELLLKGGDQIAITRKMFDTLLVLVENADRVVPKQELMDKVWHDRFVEDSSLSFNIKMLRKALGDDAASPTFIQTVPRRGYRFIAELKPVEPKLEVSTTTPNTVQSHDMTPHSRVARWKRYVTVTAFALTLVVAAAFVASYLWQQRAAERGTWLMSGFKATKLSDTGTVYNAAISPDGKYVAYTIIVSGMQSLWLRHMDSASNTTVVPPSDDMYTALAFSPAGDALYFVRTRVVEDAPQVSMLYRIPVFGGVPTKLAEDMQGYIAVSPDDRFVSFVRNGEKGTSGNRLFLTGTDGTGERQIAVSDHNTYFTAHSFSPDGRTLAVSFGSTMTGSQLNQLVTIDVETGDRKDLSEPQFFHVRDIEWLANGREILFCADEKMGDTVRIWHLDRDDRRIRPLTPDLTDFASVSTSRDGTKFLTTSFRPDFQLVVRDPTSGSGLKTLTQARDDFVFAPDGRIVFASDTAGNEDIWIMEGDGGDPRQLTNHVSLDRTPLVSSDGKSVYFTSNRSGENQIWRMEIDGSNQTQVTKTRGGFSVYATTDNKYLFYQSSRSKTLAKVALETGEETKYEFESGYLQTISPDGTLLAFLHRPPQLTVPMLKVVKLETGTEVGEFPLPPVKGFPYFLQWQDADTLGYVVNAYSDEDAIWLQELDDKQPRIFQKLESGGIRDFRFTPGGKSFGLIRGSWKHDAVLLTAE